MNSSELSKVNEYLKTLYNLSEHTQKAYKRDIAFLQKFCKKNGISSWSHNVVSIPRGSSKISLLSRIIGESPASQRDSNNSSCWGNPVSSIDGSEICFIKLVIISRGCRIRNIFVSCESQSREMFGSK